MITNIRTVLRLKTMSLRRRHAVQSSSVHIVVSIVYTRRGTSQQQHQQGTCRAAAWGGCSVYSTAEPDWYSALIRYALPVDAAMVLHCLSTVTPGNQCPCRERWTGLSPSPTIYHCCLPLVYTLCLKNTHQLWNGIDHARFWRRLAEMFQFSCTFAFKKSTFRLSNRIPKIARILTLHQANAPSLTRCNY